MKNRVLITGVAGFIGYHTAKRFLDNGWEVVGVDNLNSHNYSVDIKHDRVNLLKNEKFIFYHADLLALGIIDYIFNFYKFDLVINLAALAGVRKSLEIPEDYYNNNVMGLLNILNCIREYQPKCTLIQASTSSVYGDNKPPFKETMNCSTPLSPYAASKKAAEELCHTYHYNYGLNILVPRFFTVYGEMGRPDMSIIKFINAIRNNETITIYGDGKQERSFTYVGDLTECLYKARKFKGYDVVNVGNDKPVSVNRVIDILGKHIGDYYFTLHTDRHKCDILKTCPDISKAYKLFKWKPKTRIEDGLLKVLEGI